MDEILDIFREEAREHLRTLETGFLDLEDIPDANERRRLIDNLFRHAHSLKGDARAVGVEALQQSSQVLEDALDEMRSDPSTVGKPLIDSALTQLDVVRGAFENWEIATSDPSSLASGGPPAADSVNAVPTVSAVGNENLPEPTELASEDTAVESVNATPAASAIGSTNESFTVRVPAERLDRMLNLAGELRVTQQGGASVIRRMRELDEFIATLLIRAKRFEKKLRNTQPTSVHGRTSDLLQHEPETFGRDAVHELRQQIESTRDQLHRIANSLRRYQNRESMLVESLEANIRKARLLPLSMLTDTLRRAVRELAQSLGKTIHYEVDVGHIMVDKVVIEALKDPLQHLVRNAADHGLETPQDRIAAGKPEAGVIKIAASQRGELVRITVSDDGRGIDFARVRKRALEFGLADQGRLGELRDADVARFLFHPGFSTAATGKVSGRGVGLDVVLDTVQRLQGTVDVVSHPVESGTGFRAATQFVIHIPVSVSTVRILTVIAGGQSYGITTTNVLRTGRIRLDELKELGNHPVLSVNGEPVRWVYLSDLLELPNLPQSNRETCSYVLLGDGQRQVAIAVDDLEDESEVLLKPLEYPLSQLPGIVGATVRSNGTVQFVLDTSENGLCRASKPTTRPTSTATVAGRILIADDSPTTRTILRNLLSAAGYAVITASDGVDALERLKNQQVDLVVSDVEMPRLNGIDLARQIKLQFGYPVILVTGREKEQHRREGLEAGADAYVVKSTFEGDGLLEIVRQFV